MFPPRSTGMAVAGVCLAYALYFVRRLSSRAETDTDMKRLDQASDSSGIPRECKRYRRKPDQPVTAMPLKLDGLSLSYTKWGGKQHAKPGDWLVDNNGDVYTVNAEVFAKTYAPVPEQPCKYVKVAEIWAMPATDDGKVQTKEGFTDYQKGDYLVYSKVDSKKDRDRYAIKPDKFHAMYEED